MALPESKLKEYMKRLLLSRMRILCDNGFYGLLLMHMKFAIDEGCETAYTDGVKIAFSPEFLDDLSDSELDFVMMHEILHVVLQHCFRDGDRNSDAFNIACDIVVNSNIMHSNGDDPKTITLSKYGEAMHITPDNKEGWEFTAEEVYDLLPEYLKKKHKKGPSDEDQDGGSQGQKLGRKDSQSNIYQKGQFDDHSKWGEYTKEELDELHDLWVNRFEDAVESLSVRDPSNTYGGLPGCAQRLIDELRAPQIDWRTILNEFVQEEVNDYSFTPPDRRFQDGDFFLPDFNDTETVVKDILFMIDTSGSMSDEGVKAAYSEVKGAIDQYNGKLQGWLGFFDAGIIEPKPFTNEEEFKNIRAAGGGGTEFDIIFTYVQRHMSDHLPVAIIILTDGYAAFPRESITKGIPVLWLLTTTDVEPPWGKIARIKV